MIELNMHRVKLRCFYLLWLETTQISFHLTIMQRTAGPCFGVLKMPFLKIGMWLLFICGLANFVIQSSDFDQQRACILLCIFISNCWSWPQFLGITFLLLIMEEHPQWLSLEQMLYGLGEQFLNESCNMGCKSLWLIDACGR